MAGLFLHSEFLSEICREEITKEIFFHIFVSMSDRGLNSGLTSNKPTHYLLDYGGDF